jgi:hypothetical protein
MCRTISAGAGSGPCLCELQEVLTFTFQVACYLIANDPRKPDCLAQKYFESDSQAGGL